MSQPHLPDDPATWPRDPYQLLQVTRGVDRQALRRAYTRLIRSFKPEHCPEQFRLIRDAYETVLKHVEWHESIGGSSDEDGQSDDDQAQDSYPAPLASATPAQIPVAGEPSELSRRLNAGARGASLDDELDWLWNRSCDGQQRRAYRRLVELERQHRGHQQICIRLYWLRVIWPKLDAERTPCHWLAQGLAASGLKGPLGELYRREIEDHPVEGVSDRFGELLDLPIDFGLLVEPVRWRWQAAAWLSRWEVIRQDLSRLRVRIAVGAEGAWAQMLLAAVEQLVWAGPQQRELVQSCCRQLDDLYHLHRELAPELDRVDFLRTAGAGWHNLHVRGELPAELMRLVPLSVTRPLSETALEWWLVLEDLVETPGRALSVFDHIWQSSPPVLAQINEVLRTLSHGDSAGIDDDPRNLDLIRPLVRAFLEENTRRSYKKLRPHLMEFCLREAISADQVVLASDDSAIFHLQDGTSLVELLSADVPLQITYLAHKGYWG